MRIPDFEAQGMSAAQRRVHDLIVAGPRGRVEGPLRVWMTSPELADTSQALGAFCRYGGDLPARLSELAIITIGAAWRAGFEWRVHAPLAAAAGISREAIDAIRASQEPPLTLDDEIAVHAFTRELIETRKVGDACFDRVRQLIGDTALVELVGVIGYYTYISMTIVTFEVETPGGDPF